MHAFEPRDALGAIFLERGERRQARRGDVLHVAGDTLRNMHMLTTGWIGRVRANAAGDQAFTGIHIAGDVVGLDAVTGGRLDDDLIALTDVAVLRMPSEALRARVAADAEAAMVLVRLLAADAGFLREALLAIGRQNSVERIGAFILQTYHRLVAAGIVAEGATRFELPLTQAQLAAVTGMTGVHVNRVIRLLRDARCVDIRGGMVRIDDMDALQREARMGTLAHSRAAMRG